MNERTGLLVDVDDHRRLAAAVKRFIEEPELATEIADGASKFVKQHYMRDEVQTLWLDWLLTARGTEKC